MTCRRFVAPLVLVVVFAACSSSTKTTSSTTLPNTPTSGSKGPRTVIDTAAHDPSLATLATALNVGGLLPTVSGHGPYTLFAPTNDAFTKLPRTLRLAVLLQPARKAQLAQLLSYHLVRGRLRIKDLKPGPLKTLEGGTLTVAKHGNKVTITDSHGNVATIVRPDISATNGMIQVVDRLLVPPTK
jgi:uncharacterized surface protein with fasciclin (FAS1) repeats